MMRRAIALLLAAFAVATSAVAAPDQNPSQPLTVKGDVPVRCKMSPPVSGGSGTNTTFAQNSSGGEIDLTALVDANTAKTLAAQETIQFPIICTGAHTLTVTTQHGGLVNQNVAAPAGGFAVHADYTLNATWAGTTRSLTTSGAQAALDLSQSDAAGGELTIGFSLLGGVGPLQAGTYSDEIVVQLNAAP
jgi:hypothetical protein